jgi:serine/threonine protein kinase/Tol biopolymer transport system component
MRQEDRLRRFKHEGRAASAISHPNVAHIYEIGEVDEKLFIAMEFVDGQTLRQRLGDTPLTLSEVLDVMTQVASGIVAAHNARIIHRDIKPENIIIREDGLVKVVDFGLAKLTAPEANEEGAINAGVRATNTLLTEPGLLMGTASYMSPEQARGQDIDARTDVWSWGVVLYEMLAGKLPFNGATNSDVIAEILKSEPALLRTKAESIPSPVIELLRLTLAKDRQNRFATAKDLETALKELRQKLESTGLLGLTIPFADRLGIGRTPDLPKPSEEITEGRDSATANNVSLPKTSSVRSIEGFTGFARRVLTRPAALALIALLSVGAFAVLYGLKVRRSFNRMPKPLEIVNLTTDGRVMDAAISQDGRLLAYVPIQFGKQSLRIRNLETNENWELLPPDPALCWGMRFTPNNQTIFYVTKQPGSTIGVLYRMSVRGGPSQKLVVNVDSPAGLSPDGMQLAFVRAYPGQHRDALIVANVDGSAEREVLSRVHPERLSMSGVSWSPDAKLIAVGASRHDETEVAVLAVPTNGEMPIELTPWQWAKVLGVVWKNDGRTILFSAQKPGSNALQIWRLSYPEKQISSVTSDNNEYEEATLGPNVLVATHTYEESDVWSVDQSNVRRLTTDGHNGADGLTTTGNGRTIYTVGEYASSQIWSMNFDGSDRKVLTKNPGVLPASSVDGKVIAYVSAVGGAHHIWVMDSSGKNDRQLTFGDGENYPTVTADGRSVFYIARAKERGTLFKVAAAGGQPVQLPFTGIIVNPVISPDGKNFACTYREDEADRWKVAVFALEGREPLKTFAVPYPYYQIIRWTDDGKSFTYLDKQNGVQNVWRQPLDGSPPSKITDFPEDLILHYAWFGQRLILSRGGRRRDIVLMKNVD